MRLSFDRFVRGTIPCLALALAVACGGTPEPATEAAAPAQRVENAGLGIALGSVPTGFSLATNAGETLELQPDGERPGKLSFTIQGGHNLVDAVNGHRDSTVTQPDGEYKGQIELGSHLGTAFASRGQYTGEDGATVEDFRIFVLHPEGRGVLTLIYSYPAGDDTAARRDELLGTLGEVESLTSQAAG